MKIRDVIKEDLDTIWQLIKEESFELTEKILAEMFEGALKMISFEDIKMGFAFILYVGNENNQEEYELAIYINPEFRRKGYGSQLLSELEQFLKTEKQREVRIENMLKYYDASEFLKTLNYNMWYSSSLMTYTGELFNNIPTDLVAYDNKYYEAVNTLKAEAFYELRKENNIKPYATPESPDEREKMLKAKDEYRLKLEGDTVIGLVQTTDDYVSLAMVGQEFRGKGHGKELVKFATNRILNEGYDTSNLYIMDTNVGARKLYESIGYDLISTVHVYRKSL